VSRLYALSAVGIAGLVLAAGAGGALEVRLSVSPTGPAALEPARITLRTYLPLVRADGSCCRLPPGGPAAYPFRVEAVSPRARVVRIRVAKAAKHLWRVFRFPNPGRWQVRVANYGPSYRHAPGARPRIWVTVRAPVPTPPPEGFGNLGRPGCTPASPRDSSTQGLSDVFGTAVGGEQLWALPFLPVGTTWGSPTTAVFDGLVGKEMKIVFGMTAFHQPFRAVAPDGSTLLPVWGPSFHGSSSWDRQPGAEWGAGFVFPEPGCWRIGVGTRGDLFLDVRS
jgi:hypothetical protein